MSESNTDKQSKKIDRAMIDLLKACEGEIKPEAAESLKVKADILKTAMAWEKIKHNIREKDNEGTEWGNKDE